MTAHRFTLAAVTIAALAAFPGTALAGADSGKAPVAKQLEANGGKGKACGQMAWSGAKQATNDGFAARKQACIDHKTALKSAQAELETAKKAIRTELGALKEAAHEACRDAWKKGTQAACLEAKAALKAGHEAADKKHREALQTFHQQVREAKLAYKQTLTALKPVHKHGAKAGKLAGAALAS